MPDDDDDLDDLLKPLSAKVQPKGSSWANESVGTRGDKRNDPERAQRSLAVRLWHKRRKAGAKKDEG